MQREYRGLTKEEGKEVDNGRDDQANTGRIRGLHGEGSDRKSEQSSEPRQEPLGDANPLPATLNPYASISADEIGLTPDDGIEDVLDFPHACIHDSKRFSYCIRSY